ncbi:MAG: methyl-accepting chemotaxis protein [Burkholderiales bacterium]|nr:methyl-accepting chemotaxis protein [Burkholderiales bacterium]
MQTLSFSQRAMLSFVVLALLNLATALVATMGGGEGATWALAALGAIAAVAGGGWWLSRATSGLDKVEVALKRLEQGDFRHELRSDATDEFGTLIGLVKSLAKQQRTLISDILTTSRALSDQAAALDNAAESLADQTGKQSDQAMQVSAATQQMNRSVDDISRATGDTAQTAAQAKEVLRESQQNMQASLASTNRIVEVVGDARATLDDLNQAVSRIGSMTGTIKEIADQTNLLALNAAIEAARAGESGRGFAVVADEVRKLAERTSQSTLDINNNVANIQLVTQATLMTMDDAVTEVSNGTAAIEACSKNLLEVNQASEQTVTMTSKIADAVHQQSAAADDVAKTIERMTVSIDVNNREAHALALSADSLSKTAASLKALVARFETSL